MGRAMISRLENGQIDSPTLATAARYTRLSANSRRDARDAAAK